MISKSRITGYFFTFLATILILLSFSFSGNAQTFPEGLVGLSSGVSAVYSIDASNGTATPIVTLDGRAVRTGLSYLQGTLYGTDLSDFPGSMGRDIGSISTDGTITFLSDQNGSFNWWGLASDDCEGERGVLYSIDASNNNILTAQFPDGSVETIGSGAGINDGVGMAYDDRNGILYAIDRRGRLFTVSTVTGDSDLIGFTGLIFGPRSAIVGLAYDEINRILYANDGGTRELYTLNVSTGAGTLVGSNGVEVSIDGLAWMDACEEVIVPTLSEWGLIAMAGLLGIVGFMVMRRRKAFA